LKSNRLFSTEGHVGRHREKRGVRTSWGECPGYSGWVYFCSDKGTGGERLRGDTGPKGDNGAPGSSKIINNYSPKAK